LPHAPRQPKQIVCCADAVGESIFIRRGVTGRLLITTVCAYDPGTDTIQLA